MLPDSAERRRLLSADIAGAEIHITEQRVDKRVARVYGFGIREVATESGLGEITAFLKEQNVDTVRFRVPPTEHALEVAEWLVQRGMKRSTFVVQWIATCDSIRSVETEFDIRAAQDGDREALGRLIAEGYRIRTPEGVEFHSRIGEIPGMTCYLCFDGEKAIGTGAIYRDHMGCILEYATTEKTYRNRGVQTAMIGFRLNEARKMGCEWACASTMTNDRSSRNLRKQGFVKAYDEQVYVCDSFNASR